MCVGARWWWCWSSVGAGPALGGDAAEVVAPAAAAVGVGAAEHHGQPDRESAAEKRVSNSQSERARKEWPPFFLGRPSPA